MRSHYSIRTALIVTPLLLMVAAAGTLVSAQRGGNPPSRATPPSGAEIAAAARAGKLDMANVGTATMFGKPFKFTPVQVATGKPAAPPTDANEAAKGLFAGVLENGAPGDETGLPAGKYNIFVANISGQWKGYAEANGQIVREAIRTTATPAQPGAKAPPKFGEKGWWIGVYHCDYRFDQFSGTFLLGCWWTKVYF